MPSSTLKLLARSAALACLVALPAQAEDAEMDLDLDLGEAAQAAGIPSAEDFYWNVRSVKENATGDEVMRRLGEPKRIEIAKPAAGATRETWFYEVRRAPEAIAAEGPGAATTGEVTVIMDQPLGLPLGYEKAEVFIHGKYGKATQALKEAIIAWKKDPTPRKLLAVVREMPRGARAKDIVRLLDKPLNASHKDYGKGDVWGMAYHSGDDIKIIFKMEVTRDMNGEPVARYTGATFHVRPKDPQGLHLQRSAPIDRTQW